LFLYATFPALVLVVARFDRGVGSLLVVTAVVAATMTMIALLFDLAGLGDLGRGDPNSAHRWLYRSPLFRVGDFALGILSARLYLRLRYWSRSERLGGILIMVALVATAALATNSSLLFSAGSWDVGYAIPAFALLLGLALAPRHRVSRFLAIPVVVLLGESSYAFYLVHMPILGSLGASGWGVQFNPMTATIQVFHLGIVLALAVGLHQLVEIPARSWLRARLGNVPGDRTLRIGPRQGTRG
jgi:peptidoglycan/LPS O-acetylase OafA/YrhL